MSHRRVLVLAAAMGALVACRTSGGGKPSAQPVERAGQAGRVPDTQERATQAEGSAAAGTSGATAGTSDATTGATTGTTGMASQDELTGRVALLDAGEREIAIDSGTATTQVKVADDAKITVDGKSGSFSEIPQGAEVRARLDRSGDSPKAIEIEVMPSDKKPR